MINKFILKDNADDNFSDLIIFDKPVNKEELFNKIQKKKEELKDEYTNEDMYKAIDELKVDYQIIWLGDLFEIVY